VTFFVMISGCLGLLHLHVIVECSQKLGIELQIDLMHCISPSQMYKSSLSVLFGQSLLSYSVIKCINFHIVAHIL